jgi:hypothetical protein
MSDETIQVRNTASGDLMDVLVLRKRTECIEVVIGKGQHSVTCELTPTRTGAVYAGSVMGRELVYERSREQVKAEVEQAEPRIRPSRPSRPR